MPLFAECEREERANKSDELAQRSFFKEKSALAVPLCGATIFAPKLGERGEVMLLETAMQGVHGMHSSQSVLNVEPSRLQPAPRILIVRMSAFGDVIHGIPTLCALRQAIPDAFIGWLVEGRNGDILEGHAALDTLIRVPRRFWKSPREIWNMRCRLRSYQFDTAIDLQCLTKSAVSAWLSGARRRIGKAGEDGRELSRWFHNEFAAPGGTHVIESYLSMLAPLGIRTSAVNFDLQETADDAQAVDRFLRERGLAGRRFALLNPGAGWPSKIWPTVRYGAMARYLGREHGMPSLALWGVPKERPMAERIVETSARNGHLAPPTTMRELAALCRRAAIFVGSDTGPMHLAAAVGTPTVSLHGPSRSEWYGAYGPRNVRLQARYENGSATRRRTADDSAMQEITLKMVYEACDRLLGTQDMRRAG
jgi:lipopolysaccharide heptosyltransferase I